MTSLVMVFTLICLLLSDGVKGGWNLTKEEDEDLDRQLRVINKPAIKIIENDDGDVIDCVDFDKQPSFDHLSSKNQGWNISHPNASNEAHMPSLTISKVALKSARCPQGTVPIRRTTKEDLLRSKLSSKFGLAYGPVTNLQNFPSAPGVHWAVLVSDRGSYKGANAVFEVYSLSGVEMNQYSGTTITIFSGTDGPPDKFNVISVGWLVHPSLYGDDLPRFTVFWTTNGYQSTNCFNFQCPGFIQKSTNYFPGMSLKDEITLPLAIYKDEQTGGWCISTLNGKSEEIIGCWPGSVFSSLEGNAEFIEWGGTVMSPTDHKSPPMGNGQFPWNQGALVSKIHMIDEQLKLGDPKGRPVADKPKCYDVFQFTNSSAHGWSFYYGGPGGCIG